MLQRLTINEHDEGRGLRLRVAVVHEWLDEFAGSELVLAQILRVFPQADLFCLVDYMAPADRAFLHGKKPQTTFFQHLPFARKLYRKYLPLMPLAAESIDVSSYDLVISSSHAVAKGILTGPDQVHVCYCHTPLRYAWDLQHQYLRQAGFTRGFRRGLASLMLHYLRLWDRHTADGVDVFIANSHYIARRIRRVYRRTAEIVYPPVRTDLFRRRDNKEDYYLAVCRSAPYKRLDIILAAFARMPERRLVVVNSGGVGRTPQAPSRNITILGRLSEADLIDWMQRSRAFVFAGEEDFGITLVEAQACGTPVIAFGKGGAVETVLDGQTGVLFEEQSPESLIDAVDRFETMRHRFSPSRIRANAERFSVEVFEKNLRAVVEKAFEPSAQAGAFDDRALFRQDPELVQTSKT